MANTVTLFAIHFYWMIAANGKCWVVKPKLNDCTWAQKDCSLSSSLFRSWLQYCLLIASIGIRLIWVLSRVFSNLLASLCLYICCKTKINRINCVLYRMKSASIAINSDVKCISNGIWFHKVIFLFYFFGFVKSLSNQFHQLRSSFSKRSTI